MTGVSPLDASGLLAALSDAGIDFVVIGGFAVSAHGYPRATHLDIVPAPDPENLKHLAAVLKTLNATLLGMEELSAEEIVQPDAEGLAMGGNFVLATSSGRPDVMQLVAPDLDFGELADASVEDEVFGHQVRFCSYEHLVVMKEAAGRPEDLLDLERLRQARGE